MIIHDFLDNDLYKFTAMNAIQKKFPDSEVVYRFVNRGNTSFPPGFADALKKEVEAMAGVVLSKENEKFMRAKCYYFDSVFFDLLKGFRFNPAEVKVSQEGGKLDVEIRLVVPDRVVGSSFNGDDLRIVFSDDGTGCP